MRGKKKRNNFYRAVLPQGFSQKNANTRGCLFLPNKTRTSRLRVTFQQVQRRKKGRKEGRKTTSVHPPTSETDGTKGSTTSHVEMGKTTTALVEREARHSSLEEYARGIERRRRVNVINARERAVKLVGGLNLGACLRLRRTWGSLVHDNW